VLAPPSNPCGGGLRFLKETRSEKEGKGESISIRTNWGEGDFLIAQETLRIKEKVNFAR